MIPASNVSFMWDTVIRPRVGTPYGWGASFDPNDTLVGTDCSGAVSAVIEALVNGPAMDWNRQFWTGSFQGLQPGQIGPFGLVCIAGPDDHPADAAAIVAIRQGPSAESSHMMCQVQGINIEDGDGLVVGDGAADIHDSQFNQWFYLPGPIESAPLSKADQYAVCIIHEGERRNISPRGVQIALSVALVESNLQNYANSNVPESLNIPHDAVGSDHDSLGLFQQRCPMWGPAEVLMNPTLSAGLFYDQLVRLDYNGPNSPGSYAQAVQRSAFPDRYDERWPDAVDLYNRLAGTPSGPQEDELSAEAERQINEIYHALLDRGPSLSALREPSEGSLWSVIQLVRNIDGLVHPLAVEDRCRLGDPREIARCQRVAANADPARQDDAAMAATILDRLHSDYPTPASAPAPVTPAYSPPPTASTPGQIIGKAYDALAELQLSGALTDAERAPLEALITVLQGKTGRPAS